LHLIAKKSDGALRDALSIFDRLVNFTEGNITKQLAFENLNVLDYDTYFQTYEYLIKNDITNVLLLLNEVIEKGFDGQHYIDGFSTHLRDLMVAKNSSTQILLRQNDTLSKKYVEQSKIKPIDFILKAIDLTQECSYRYKSSKNQRLLVEICLMKLCSISQIELKKKIIILPSSIIEKKESSPQKNNDNQIDSELPTNHSKKEEKFEEITIKSDKEKIISGLSISSLKIKKDIEKKKKTEKQSKELENLKELFNAEDLEREWKVYYTNLLKNGKKNLASILQIDQPKIKNKSEIHFTLSNNTNKIELEKNKFGLVSFLKERLKNNKIELFINVNKEKEKKFIYSPMEKFEKLKSINNSIEKMRKEFKLGL
jgi:DNA polymerase-3 subunit gamma/tau